MQNKFLNLEQNTCAARIFLNTFGLTLETISNIDQFSKIKIFDKNMKEVGNLYFNDGRVIIEASYNDIILEASYNISEIFGFIDTEFDTTSCKQWDSKITFQIQNSNISKLDGKFTICSAVGSEFGVACRCHPLINCEVSGKGKFILKMLEDTSLFVLEIINDDYCELIDIMPYDKFNGFIKHRIIKGKYNEEKCSYPYDRYSGVVNAAERGENKNKLLLLLIEEEYNNIINSYKELVPKNAKNETTNSLLQKGSLMQKLDSDMFKKINELREILLIGDVSLLDNLISVCYDSFTDEELNALLGLNRNKMNYQDGSENLINSYYGFNKNSYFFSPETSKKLKKKTKKMMN